MNDIGDSFPAQFLIYFFTIKIKWKKKIVIKFIKIKLKITDDSKSKKEQNP